MGWLMIDREITNHKMFQNKEFCELGAWLWLLTHAAWKNTQHRVGNKMHDVPRGSLYASLSNLQKAWGWKSTKRVTSFLELLKHENMILINRETGKTRVSICNYSKYQNVGNATETRRKRDGNATETLKEQDNNKQDISGGKKPPKSKPLLPLSETWEPSPEYIKIAMDKKISLAAAHSEAEKFKFHALENDRRCRDWKSAFRNWIIKALEYNPTLGKDVTQLVRAGQ